MAQPIHAEHDSRTAAPTQPSWAVTGSSMGRHLDRLEESSGRPAVRDLVDAVLRRLEHHLLRLESAPMGPELLCAAAALRDCGASLGNAALVQAAAALCDEVARHPHRLGLLVGRALSEGRRTSSWLRVWRALSTPTRSAGLSDRLPGPETDGPASPRS